MGMHAIGLHEFDGLGRRNCIFLFKDQGTRWLSATPHRLGHPLLSDALPRWEEPKKGNTESLSDALVDTGRYHRITPTYGALEVARNDEIVYQPGLMKRHRVWTINLAKLSTKQCLTLWNLRLNHNINTTRVYQLCFSLQNVSSIQSLYRDPKYFNVWIESIKDPRFYLAIKVTGERLNWGYSAFRRFVSRIVRGTPERSTKLLLLLPSTDKASAKDCHNHKSKTMMINSYLDMLAFWLST